MDFRICTGCGLAMGAGAARCSRCGGSPAPADARAFIGQAFGKYALVELIGEGGMGVVLRGRHVALGHPVAVKLLQPGLGDAAFRERFLREARLLAGLRHPGIVEVHDFDVSPGDVPYYVMEYLEGESLAAEIARSPQGLPIARVMAIVRGIVAALAHAHARDIVHRDLKPDNVFLAHGAGHEQVKLLDFGIARVLEDDAAATRLTQVGHVIGTPQYFAPEQFYGYPVTLATDQYALALIVAEMLRGSPLRSGRSFSEISLDGLTRAPATMTAELPRDTPPAISAALALALAVDPAQRHADVGAFLLALERDARVDVATRPAPARAIAATIARAPPRPRWRFLSGVAAAAVLASALAVGPWRSPAPAPSVAAPADVSPARGWLRERASYGVPVDARSVLARRDDVAVLASADGWYLRPLHADVEASRVVLPHGQRLLGALEEGLLAVATEDALQAIDPVSAQATLLARLPKELAGDAIVRVSPDARTVVAASARDLVLWRRDGERLQHTARVADAAGAPAIALSRRWLALVDATGARVRVLRTSDGTVVLEHALDLGAVRDLALLDAPPRLAVAGREPEIDVFALDGSAPMRASPVQRGAQSLAWLADAPTLVVAGEAGVRLWRDGAFLEEIHGAPASTPAALQAGGAGVLLLDGAAHRLAQLDYGVLPVAQRVDLGKTESWAVHVDAVRHAVYVGSSDGVVYAVEGGKVVPHALHADGVTALAGDADHLASASDDRTLAIWNLPAMDVRWRSRGHDYLVNQIALLGPSLWSSSSDGTLKRWRWPSLDEEETLDLRALTATPDLRLHAFWIARDRRRGLVGTWNHRLVELERGDGGDWSARAHAIDSEAGYHLLELEKVRIVLVEGADPTRLYAWDTDTRRLLALPDFGHRLWTLTSDGHGGAFAAGRGAVLRYVIARSADGALHLRVEAAVRSDLGDLTAAEFDATADRLWLADSGGHLLALEAFRLPLVVLYEGPLVDDAAAPAGSRLRAD
ncbi:MAG: WD40 repeat domain-containing serine/threonine protein kinase [Dokdonella sp.]|uniref:WD40 repeat domain-containing serine/threonine protein kinase n=1 Tax=Dokdonella sp. TaxID=2291710 RepID=UPI003F809DCE